MKVGVKVVDPLEAIGDRGKFREGFAGGAGEDGKLFLGLTHEFGAGGFAGEPGLRVIIEGEHESLGSEFRRPERKFLGVEGCFMGCSLVVKLKVY